MQNRKELIWEICSGENFQLCYLALMFEQVHFIRNSIPKLLGLPYTRIALKGDHVSIIE